MATPNNNAETADEIILSWLQYYGIDDTALITEVVSAWKQQKIADPSNVDQIAFAIRDTDAYKKRFAGNLTLQAQGKPMYSISEYLQLERDYKRAMQGSGLPAGFYDSYDDFSKFIGGDVSPAEILDRVQQGYQAVAQSNPEVIRQMKELYGVTEGDLAAYFLDPDKTTPILLQRSRAAQIGAEAQRQAGMQLTTGMAESLARENITAEEARRGFAGISEAQQLFAPLSATEQQIGVEEQIGAVLGTNAAAAQRVRKRAAERAAEGMGGGSFATSQGGVVTGLTNA
jgi:hypothetical protein